MVRIASADDHFIRKGEHLVNGTVVRILTQRPQRREDEHSAQEIHEHSEEHDANDP